MQTFPINVDPEITRPLRELQESLIAKGRDNVHFGDMIEFMSTKQRMWSELARRYDLDIDKYRYKINLLDNTLVFDGTFDDETGPVGHA